MIRFRPGLVFGAISALVAAFCAGAIWSSSNSAGREVIGPKINSGDTAMADAEAAANDAQQDFDRAMANLNSPPSRSNDVSDPDIQMGERHAIELNELICKEYGQNCELAKLARRQYQEKYDPQ